jgi:hypothetical protein
VFSFYWRRNLAVSKVPILFGQRID